MIKFTTYILVLIVALVSGLQAADITVESALDRNKAYIGDRLNYELNITADSALQIDTVAPENLMGDFKVLNWQLKQDTIVDGQRRMQFSGVITTFETGKVVIPAFPVKYKIPPDQIDSIFTDSIEVSIVSLMLDDSTADIHGLKGVKAFGGRLTWIFYLIPAVIVITALIVWLIMRKKKGEEYYETAALLSPWDEARASLIRLKEQSPEPKPFYLAFSEIVRRYLQRRFAISALDMTTYEIVQVSGEINIDPELKTNLIKMLEHSDLVKFAKLIPSADQIDSDLKGAWSFVESTTPGKQADVEDTTEVQA